MLCEMVDDGADIVRELTDPLRFHAQMVATCCGFHSLGGALSTHTLLVVLEQVDHPPSTL